jgi:hypothetical protein
MIVQETSGRFTGYGTVGWIAAALMLVSIALALVIAPKPAKG